MYLLCRPFEPFIEVHCVLHSGEGFLSPLVVGQRSIAPTTDSKRLGIGTPTTYYFRPFKLSFTYFYLEAYCTSVQAMSRPAPFLEAIVRTEAGTNNLVTLPVNTKKRELTMKHYGRCFSGDNTGTQVTQAICATSPFRILFQSTYPDFLCFSPWISVCLSLLWFPSS